MDEKTSKAVFVCIGWRMAGTPDGFHVILAKFLTNDVFGLLKEHQMSIRELEEFRPDIKEALGDICALRAVGIITAKHAKDLLAAVWSAPYVEVCDHLVATKMLEETSGNELADIVRGIVDANPKVIAQIRSGKPAAIGFLVGQAMKATKGKAEPGEIRRIIAEAVAADVSEP